MKKFENADLSQVYGGKNIFARIWETTKQLYGMTPIGKVTSTVRQAWDNSGMDPVNHMDNDGGPGPAQNDSTQTNPPIDPIQDQNTSQGGNTGTTQQGK